MDILFLLVFWVGIPWLGYRLLRSWASRLQRKRISSIIGLAGRLIWRVCLLVFCGSALLSMAADSPEQAGRIVGAGIAFFILVSPLLLIASAVAVRREKKAAVGSRIRSGNVSPSIPAPDPFPRAQSFFIFKNEEVCGPYIAHEIENLRRTAVISSDTLCCREGSETWVPLSDLGPVTSLYENSNTPSSAGTKVPAETRLTRRAQNASADFALAGSPFRWKLVFGSVAAALLLSGTIISGVLKVRSENAPLKPNGVPPQRSQEQIAGTAVHADEKVPPAEGESVAGSESMDELTRLKRAEETGEASAQFALGCHYGGRGIAQDHAEAAKWFRKAAEQRHANAQWVLATYYYEGRGVTQDHAEAVKWYRRAAEQGVAEAQHNLGVRYANGLGVVQDDAEAVKWFRKAAEQGAVEAQYNLGRRYSNGKGVAQDYAEAVKWFRKAAEKGSSDGRYYLGLHTFLGYGVVKDRVEGLAWMYLGSSAGEAKRMELLNLFELEIGRGASQIAQQRSREILKEVTQEKRNSKPDIQSTDPAPPGQVLTGSGTIVSSNGLVITAAHVVEGAKTITVMMAANSQEARLLKLDTKNDIAVLKLDDGLYPAASVSTSSAVRLGESVATIGFPNIFLQGFSPKATRGEINSENGAMDDPRMWQISVPVQPGNSGGPLFDENGTVIGIIIGKLEVDAGAAAGDIPQNVNYAIKSDYFLPLLREFIESDVPNSRDMTSSGGFAEVVASLQPSVVLIVAE